MQHIILIYDRWNALLLIVFSMIMIHLISFFISHSHAQNIEKMLSHSQQKELQRSLKSQICYLQKQESLKKGVYKPGSNIYFAQGIRLSNYFKLPIQQHLQSMYQKHGLSINALKSQANHLIVTSHLWLQASHQWVVGSQLKAYCLADHKSDDIKFKDLIKNVEIWKNKAHTLAIIYHDKHLGLSIVQDLGYLSPKQSEIKRSLTEQTQMMLESHLTKSPDTNNTPLYGGQNLYLYHQDDTPLYQVTLAQKGTGMWSFYWLIHSQSMAGSPLFNQQAKWKAMIAGIPFSLDPKVSTWSANQTRLVIPYHAIQQFLHNLQDLLQPSPNSYNTP
jgi:hypothetical protein